MDRLPEGVLGSRTPRGPHALAPPATRLARAGARAGAGVRLRIPEDQTFTPTPRQMLNSPTQPSQEAHH